MKLVNVLLQGENETIIAKCQCHFVPARRKLALAPCCVAVIHYLFGETTLFVILSAAEYTTEAVHLYLLKQNSGKIEASSGRPVSGCCCSSSSDNFNFLTPAAMRWYVLTQDRFFRSITNTASVVSIRHVGVSQTDRRSVLSTLLLLPVCYCCISVQSEIV